MYETHSRCSACRCPGSRAELCYCVSHPTGTLDQTHCGCPAAAATHPALLYTRKRGTLVPCLIYCTSKQHTHANIILCRTITMAIPRQANVFTSEGTTRSRQKTKVEPQQLFLFLNGASVKLTSGDDVVQLSDLNPLCWPTSEPEEETLDTTTCWKPCPAQLQEAVWCSYPLTGAGVLSLFSDPSEGSRKALRGGTSSST